MKKDDKLLDTNSPKTDKKNSLFDDSFFDEEEEEDEDDEDDDFDFEDDDDEDDEDEDEDENYESKEQGKTDEPPFSSELNPPFSAAAPVDNIAPHMSAGMGNSAPFSTAQLNPLQGNASMNNLAQDIQFRLGCELGQVLIPYENLQNLSIGSVVDFNNTLQTLYLSVNNVRVGEGMLVDIDGKIGIKITRWYGKS